MKRKNPIICLVIALISAIVCVFAVKAAISDNAEKVMEGIVGISTFPEGADANGDGVVDVLDVIALQRSSFPGPKLTSLSFGGETLFPAFSPNVFSYTVYIPAGHPYIPSVEAEAGPGCDIEVIQAAIPFDETTGTAEVNLTSDTGENKYVINVVKTEDKGFALQYDDRYQVSASLSGSVVYTSSDPDVITVDENGKCRAVGVSSEPVTITSATSSATETFVINRVDKAKINLFFVTGQSNANGCYDLANDRGELQLTMAEQIANVEQPSDSGQVYSYNAAVNRYGNDKIGHAEVIGGYPIDEVYDMAEARNNGFASALGKTYYDLTGEKVFMLQTARNATAIEVWVKPGHEGSATWAFGSGAVNLYQATLDAYDDVMTNFLTSDKYEINHVLNFWDQGNTCMTQNFNPDYYGTGRGSWGDSEYRTVSNLPRMTDREYYDYFMDITESMKEDFGLEYQCIILARSVSSLISGESRTLQLYTDLNPIRCAQYTLGNTQDDVLLVSRVGDYVRALTSTDTESYGYGLMGLDFNHYNQTGFNEQGRVSARKMFSIFHSPVVSDSVELIAENGRTRLKETDKLTLKIGNDYLLAALALPENTHTKLNYSSSDESVATVSEFGKVTGVGAGECVITVTTENGDSQSVQFLVWEESAGKTVEYRWDFNGDLKSSLDENDLYVSATTYKVKKQTAYSMTDGILDTTDGVDFTFYKPVTISSDNDWTIEYRAKFRQVGSLFGQSNYVSNSSHNYIYVCYTVQPATYEYSFRMADEKGVINFLPFAATKEEAVALNTVWNTWKIDYVKETNKLTLWRFDETANDWEIICQKDAKPFKLRADTLFARNDETGAYTTNALVDYFYVKTTEYSTSYNTVEYTYDFDGDMCEKDHKNDLTLSPLSVENGTENNYYFEDGYYKTLTGLSDYSKRPEFVFDKPIHIDHLSDWSLEFKGKFYGPSILLGQTDNDYGQIYNAFTVKATGWNYPMQLRLDSRINKDIDYVSDTFGDFRSYAREDNRWKLEYTAENNTMSYYFWDIQGNFFTYVGSVKMGVFDIDFTNMFGRADTKGTVSFQGEMDYMKIRVSEALK